MCPSSAQSPYRVRGPGTPAGSLLAVSVSSSSSQVPKSPVKAVPAPPRPARIDPVPLATLLARADARLIADRPDAAELTVTGTTLRAQHVLPGDLFAALPGARAHGADFSDQAIAAGAVAVLTDADGAERPALRDAGVPILVHADPRAALGEIAAWIYGEPSLQLAVLGVTGTSGKTTTSYLVDAGLRAAGLTTGLIGTVETRIAGERLVSGFTTPEAPDLQALLAVMLERGVTHVPMEVSSHALALGRVNGTRFAVGAFTNLSQDHLDFHHDMEDYFAAKARLFVDDELRAAKGVVCVDDELRAAKGVVCVDDGWGRRLAGMAPDAATVSTTGRADWTARDTVTDP